MANRGIERKNLSEKWVSTIASLYMAHNHHMLAYGAMMTGQSALQAQKKAGEAERVEKAFDDTWRNADIQIKSPCLCLPGV